MKVPVRILFLALSFAVALGSGGLHAENAGQTAVILPLAPSAPPASALEAPPSPPPEKSAAAPAPAGATPAPVAATAAAPKTRQAQEPLPALSVPARPTRTVPEDAADSLPSPAAPAETPAPTGPAAIEAQPAVLHSPVPRITLDSTGTKEAMPIATAFHAPLIAPPAPKAMTAAAPPHAKERMTATPAAAPLPIAPAASATVLQPGVQLALALNKSRVIRLARPARDVLVANPAIADVVLRSTDTVFVIGRKVGETNVYFFDAAGQQIEQIDVRVDFDSGAVEAALKVALPNERIEVSTANQSVVLMGSVASAIAAENARQIARQFVGDDKSIINLLKIRGQNQVLLRVRVAEMSRQIVKELGISPSAIFNVGSSSFNLAGAAQNFTNAPFAALTATTPLGAASRLSGLIQALESNGLVKTLAEPNLTAVSGEPASFLVGGEFPVPVPQQGTGNGTTITVDYKEFGIKLTFTPVVLSPTVISLRIATEVSQLSTQGQVNFSGFVIPALSVRRAETTVELPSGGSIAIAGLLQNDIQNTIQGLPGLKNIPILGALFSSTQFQRNESDLVIAVTPLLVKPVDPNTLAFPTDGFGPASDFDMYLLGRLYGEYTKPDPDHPHGQPKGPFGYIME